MTMDCNCMNKSDYDNKNKINETEADSDKAETNQKKAHRS